MNIDKVEKMRKEAEGKARSRKYGSIDALMETIHYAEERILSFAGCKTPLVGTKCYIDKFSDHFANAYYKLGLPMSTQLECTYTRDGLRVDKIFRGICHHHDAWMTVKYTEKAKEAILRNASVFK